MVNTKTKYHKSPLEFLIFVLEGALHEDGDGFPLTGCVQVQQFLEKEEYFIPFHFERNCSAS